jgi:hypothetical protein
MEAQGDCYDSNYDHVKQSTGLADDWGGALAEP